MRAAASWIGWFAPLFGLWLAFVGATSTTEEIAGLIAAAVGATAAEVTRRQGLLAHGVPASWPSVVAGQLWRVVSDFVLLVCALVRRPRGSWSTRQGSVERDERAFTAWAGSLAPNTVVVDIDEGEIRRHRLL